MTADNFLEPRPGETQSLETQGLETRQPLDAEQRGAALDPLRSFCVTAPAGSGKTELLSQRVLGLLARAQQPEDILAITFTRKAAAEMRERIYQALLLALEPEPALPHQRHTWRLARAALARDAERGWQLLQNPQRLRVMTIDGLCSSLTAQMPVLSQFGGQPRVVERAQPLYVEAVDALLEQLEQPGPIADGIAELLLHLDNQVERLQTLLAGLLARRDQWLPLLGAGIGTGDPRTYLEDILQDVRDTALRRARAALLRYRGELLPLLDFAAVRLRELQPDAPLVQFAGCTELPPDDSAAVEAWQALAEWLLTRDGDWRRTVDKRQGFPVGDNKEQKALYKARKQAMLELLEAFGQDPALREQLEEIRFLPAAQYPDSQWRILVQITRLLALAAAQLQLVFQSRGEVDFTELSLSALRALGSELAPSDLMLRLDARIRHLLIDEFQDTSSTQFRLLEHLIEGWAEHNASGAEPQTLFIVGDGMQSIYGFREARVGLFLEARRDGVNQLPLQPAPLSVNFRSTPTIVDWVNRTFAQAFPQSEHRARGAVRYEPSSAFNGAPAAGASAVAIYGLRDDAERRSEAALCVQLVQQALARDATGSIAILVRYRTHLREIVPALARAGIEFRATDIDPLAQRATIQDILALLKALLNPADRIAWLALLRSPLVGLDNRDLHRLVAGVDGRGTRRSIPGRLHDPAVRAELSPAGAQRLELALRSIDVALAQRGRKPLRIWLEGTWLALGGALLLDDEAMWRDVRVLFDSIERLAPALDIAQLEEKLADLYARAAAPPTTRVLLMTIHKSKGLEFDTVILPSLDAGTRSDDKPLLRWSEQLDDSGTPGLVLAAKAAVGGAEDATYAWLQREHKQKQQLEDTRLLYVAATRAVSNLYLLFATATAADDEYRGPVSNSLLARIWPAVVEQVQWNALDARVAAADAVVEQPLPHTADLFAVARPVDRVSMRRVPAAWYAALPSHSPAPPVVANPLPPPAAISLEQRLGTVIHQLLEQLAALGSEAWLQREPQRKLLLVRTLLIQAGVLDAELDGAAQIAIECIDTMLRDERGRWLLDTGHAESMAEWELITDAGRRHVIDRSFVDAEGIRWIVDYKSSLPHAGEALPDFLAREAAAYTPQLQTYRALLARIDHRPLKTALYFPRIPHFLEL
jgi:ATP-dependent exoDNAse (exonuclease V) beta subunit